MTDTPATDDRRARRPRRDADGRLATAADLLGVAFGGLVMGAVVLTVVEGLMSLLRMSQFGDASGWLALVLPVWLFAEEFRVADYGAHRVVVALLGTGFGVVAGMSLAGVVANLFPPLVSGAAGAAVFTAVYCPIWFYGLRWLNHRAG